VEKIRSFTDLIVWQHAHQLAITIYQLTRSFPREETYGLTSQIRRAAVSISANIAEGFKRRHINDQLHFYSFAAASCEELRAECFLARDLLYLDTATAMDTLSKIDTVSKLLYSWRVSRDRLQ
jgi:four helix bundle protein